MSAPSITTPLTLASSISLRLRALAKRIHTLGPQASVEAMCEIVGGADPLSTYGRLGAFSLNANPSAAYGPGDLPPIIRLVE